MAYQIAKGLVQGKHKVVIYASDAKDLAFIIEERIFEI